MIRGTSQDGQAGRQTDIHTNRQTERQTDTPTRRERAILQQETLSEKGMEHLYSLKIYEIPAATVLFLVVLSVCGVMLYDISGEGKPRPNSRQNRLLPLALSPADCILPNLQQFIVNSLLAPH